MKILNAENNFVDDVHFGVEPRPDNKRYKYGKVEVVIIKDVVEVLMARKNVKDVQGF